jgi:hypothetical protein
MRYSHQLCCDVVSLRDIRNRSARIVTGVEDAGNAEEKEVRTHEVPEDDVPGEYLD